MPIQDGKYINPGFVNDTAPELNASEMNAIADTLEALSAGNIRSEEIVVDDEITIRRFGKLVMLSYKAKFPYATGGTTFPSQYAPKENQHILAPVYNSPTSGGQAFVQGYAGVFVQKTGDISVEVFNASGDVYPRFDMMYFSV